MSAKEVPVIYFENRAQGVWDIKKQMLFFFIMVQ